MTLPGKVRLQRLIALTTELSRRAAEQAIARGNVSVNGTVVTAMGTTVDPVKDRVRLSGRELRIPEHFVYIAFYKPRRTMVTKSDPEGRPTIWEMLDRWKGRLNSAGRLDFESEGLIILTNDGSMLNALTHPKHEVWKVYEAKVRGVMDEQAIERLKKGVKLEDGVTLPAEVRAKESADKNSWVEIGIREGRNRQVRRMCEAVGHPVMKLKRISVGPIKLGRMKQGEWRFLNEKELRELKRVMGL